MGSMSSDEEDERETVEHQTSPVIDEAEVHDGLRAFFPLSFGKQEAKPVSLESIHSKTKRDNEAKPAPLRERFQKSLKKKGLQEESDTHFEDYHGFVGAFPPNSRVIGPSLPSKDAELRKDIVIGPRRPSKDAELREDVVIGPRRPSKDADLRENMVIGPRRPSKDAELREDMVIGPRRPSADENSIEDMMTSPPRPSGEENSREDMMIGPPRPSADESSREDMMIGPPQPSPDENSREEIMIGPPRPSADENLREDMLIGPPMPQYRSESSKSSDQSEEEEEEDNDGDEGAYLFPVSNEIILKGHTKVVSTLAVDQTGSRVLTGSYDYSVRMYDFQGMDARLRSFRQLEPFEGHQVRSLSWSPTADRFVCVTGAAQAKIYDRDGVTLGEFLKGDMYIRDLKNTKGHISGLTCGEWNPKDKQLILTSSEDGSLRVWDVNDFKSQKQVIKPRLARPGRVAVTACTWGLDGKCLAGGLVNGSVQIWNVKAGWGSRPDIYIEKAHEDSEEVTGLHFSADGHTLLSRSTDNTLKVWDIRHTTRPCKVFSDLFNSYAQTNVAISPDEQFILTGTSLDKDGQSGGSLYFFHKQRLELVQRIGISPTESAVCCAWHPRLNQIFITTGDKKGGGTHILYDPGLSERGALICVARAPRQKSVDDFEVRPVIHHPHALPLFRDEPSRKRQREKARTDPLKSRRPDLPVTGPGFGGRVGSTKGSLLTQYLLKEGGLIKETWMEEDPREAILKYADVAAKDPQFIAPAYAKTQPETIFAESDSEEEDK